MADPTENTQIVQLSKNQLKKLRKKQERDARNAAKAGAAKPKPDAAKVVVHNPETMEGYKAMRDVDLEKLRDAGFNPYPYKYYPDYPSKDETLKYLHFNYDGIVTEYTDMPSDAELEGELYWLIGRVQTVRRAGSKLLFVDIRIGPNTFQVKINRATYKDGADPDERTQRFVLFRSVIRVGDNWGFAGHIGRTKAGELSLYVHQMRMIAPCMENLPPAVKTIEVEDNGVMVKKEVSSLTNPDVRFRMRELDMIINPHVYRTFAKRSQIIRHLENFLQDQLKLTRVDTPILTSNAGGATAKPFTTNSNDYACELFMRIAPELYLKRLIVAGFPGVYEIGKQFRNESNDLTHNSEFTSLEYYIPNSDYNDLMNQCEAMLKYVVEQVNGSTIVEYDGKKIDFAPPYARLDMLDALHEYAKIDVPDDLSTETARIYLDKWCESLGVECSEPRTTARLLDKLVGEYVESRCINPTFIVGHPKIMSPLAKPDRNGTQRTERFELFVNGTELANAYTELNDPAIQEQNFMAQAKAKASGDDEAMCLDPEFVRSLMIGLPPTGGFGMGVDRLTMFLTGNNSIREVILFPTMKPGSYNDGFDNVENDAGDGKTEV